MSADRIDKRTLFSSLHPEWPENVMPLVRAQLQISRCKLVVLDDDPTGTQTVHDIAILTEWTPELLARELVADAPAFYILTNSRSLGAAEAEALTRTIAQNLAQASQQTGQDFVVVSRSDSTLRGHFPVELEALEAGLDQRFDAWLLIPFFLEGGRFTIDDVHFVAEGDQLVPAGETPFARDAAFGYRASNLREWIAEKTAGRVPAASVHSISLEDIRQGGPNAVAHKLLPLRDGALCVVNAATMRDMQVFACGLLQAEAAGKRFLYRTAASFVQARAGLEARPLLSAADLNLLSSGGGLVIVGSYVPKTTRQVEALLKRGKVTPVEVDCAALLDEARRAVQIQAVARWADAALRRAEDVLIYTSRTLIDADDAETSLNIGQRISSGLIAILGQIQTRPRYLVAKGGITSSDVATQGLRVRRALVRGQLLPGVPVWQLGDESRYPGLPYIVFPGNVGADDALANVVQTLAAPEKSQI